MGMTFFVVAVQSGQQPQLLLVRRRVARVRLVYVLSEMDGSQHEKSAGTIVEFRALKGLLPCNCCAAGS